jgi:hypothetical protein
LALRDSAENTQLAELLIALYASGEPEVLLEVEVLEISVTRLTELDVKLLDKFPLTPLPAGGATGLVLASIEMWRMHCTSETISRPSLLHCGLVHRRPWYRDRCRRTSGMRKPWREWPASMRLQCCVLWKPYV